jgi:hypothetical protein
MLKRKDALSETIYRFNSCYAAAWSLCFCEPGRYSENPV